MSRITITIAIDVPDGSSVNISTDQVTEETSPAEVVSPPKKRKKKSTSDSADAAAVPSDTPEETETPAPSAEPGASSESTEETKPTGEKTSQAEPDDVADLTSSVLAMRSAGKVTTEQIRKCTEKFDAAKLSEIPRDKWGAYLVALDAIISEDA